MQRRRVGVTVLSVRSRWSAGTSLMVLGAGERQIPY
jgi:hypothetical protein